MIVYEVDMIQQIEITLKSKSRGFHLVTSEILSQLPKLPKTGIINIFCKHTSCGLSIKRMQTLMFGWIWKLSSIDLCQRTDLNTSILWKVQTICRLTRSQR